MKVSEAKEKVCPFMSGHYDISSEHDKDFKASTVKCICGHCMAWVSRDASEVLSNTHGYCARIGNV